MKEQKLNLLDSSEDFGLADILEVHTPFRLLRWYASEKSFKIKNKIKTFFSEILVYKGEKW